MNKTENYFMKSKTVILSGQPTDRLLQAKFHPQIAGIEFGGEIYPWRVLIHSFGFTAHKTLKNGKY